MKRGKLRSIIKKVLVGMILVVSLVSSSFTCNVYARSEVGPYHLKESSIVYKENQKRILLDLAHHDSALDNGCSYGQYNEREIANKITLQVKQLLEAEGIDVDLTRSYEDVISIADRVKLAAVKQDGRVIQFIINPSEEVQLAAVRNYGRAIKYIIHKDVNSVEPLLLKYYNCGALKYLYESLYPFTDSFKNSDNYIKFLLEYNL